MKKQQKFILTLAALIVLTIFSGNALAEKIDTIGEESDYYTAFLRETTILLEPGEMSLSLDIEYQKHQNDKVIAEINNRQFSLRSSLNWGVATGFEVYLGIPFVIKEQEGINYINETKDSENASGIGDIDLGAKFVILSEGKYPLDLIGSVSVNFPTGEKPGEDSLGTGFGFWGVSGGLNFIKFSDPAILFGGVSYSHSFADDIAGKDVQPGWAVSLNLGLGFAINDRLTIAGQVLWAYVSHTEIDSVEVFESDQEVITFRMSSSYALLKDLAIEPSVGFGLTSDSPDFSLGLSLSRRF